MPKLSEIKSWKPEIEEKITSKWSSKDLFPISPKTKKKIYSIDTPPPYVNAPIHIAQAITYCYMDFFARYKRMKGFDVLFPLGLDRNGLPIEIAAEKKYKIDPLKLGREKFIESCEKLINEGSISTTDSFSKLGISFTSYKEGPHLGSIYKTDSPKYRALTQSTFIDLYRKGLVYEENYLTNWDTKLQTTIADSEIIREEKETSLNFVKFKLSNSNEHLIIATTRPELLCTAALIIYNPKDKRYQKLKGKKAITPIFNIEVPIIEHHSADPEFGSGLVFMSKSAGDLEAVRFLREMGIKPVSAVGIDGKINSHGKLLKGLPTKEARKRIVEELKNQNLLEKQEKLIHSIPISERSGAEIEFVSMPEFYLKQMKFIKDIKTISKQINFYPKESKKILDSWLKSVKIDWPISRRRYYATPIPLWHTHSKKETLTALPPEGDYYIPWKQNPPKNSLIFKDGKPTNKTVKDYPNEKWHGETRVFDTWMDSSISELYILDYKSSDFFKKAFPATLRPQGKEIVRTWLYYTLLRGFLETKKPSFKDVWIHQHLTDEKGQKMAKSKGNVTDPKEIIKEHGAEALRFWAATEGDLSKQDLKVSKEKIKAETKTINKLLNISRFIQQFPNISRPLEKKTISPLDKLFISYIEELTNYCDEKYNSYDFYNPAIRLRRFLWEDFASHYLELVKARAYNQEKTFSPEEQKSAHYTLHFLLKRLITLLYPITPQITTIIAKEEGFNLLKTNFPKTNKPSLNPGLINQLKEFNSKVWKNKRDKGISLRDSIEGVKLPSPLKNFEKDIKACHKLG